LIIDTEAVLLKQLDSELLDLVISAPTKLLASPYQSTVLYEERYVVAFGSTHRFNELQKVSLKDIQSVPYLDRLNCELREDLKCICQNQEINLYAAYRSNSEEWILRMVQAGIGVALMPEYTLPKDATDISFRYLYEPEISRQVYAIYTHETSAKQELGALIANLSRS